jgi:SAM-dependent methyltransferase
MPTVHAAGSYILDQYHEQQREIERLRLQTLAMHEPELALLDSHGLAAARRVLDAGCGSGVLLGLMARRHPATRFAGVDVNPDLLALAANQVAGLGERVALHHAPIAALPAGEAYDFVLSRFVLQHLADPAAAVQALHGQVAPGGRLCLVDVHDDWFFLHPPVPALAELLALSADRQAALGGSRTIGRELPALLHQAGFRDVRVDVLTANSEQLGLAAFLELTIGFRPQLFAGQPEQVHAEALAAAVTQQAQGSYHFGMASAFVVSGCKA